MKKFSEDELKTLYQWIKHKEILADQKYWQEMGLSYCPTSADLPLEEKNSIIDSER